MPRVMTALPRALEDRLISEVIAQGHDVVARISHTRDLIRAVTGGSADVLLTHAEWVDAELSRECDQRGIRIVALCSEEFHRRHLSRLGIREHAPSDGDFEQIDRLLHGPAPAPSRERNSGLVAAVWGPIGSPGRTTVAVGLAVEMALTGASVALIDADTWGASVASMLGMLDESPGFAAACRLAGHGTLSIDELERVSERYPVGSGRLSILTGLNRTSRWPEATSARVAETIGICRTWVDHVIVDVGFNLESDEEILSDIAAPQRSAATLASIRAADKIIAVGRADPIGISRYVRAHSELVEVSEGVPVHTVINRVRSGPVGIGAAGQISDTLRRFAGIQGATLIPQDQKAADSALLHGTSLREASPRSAAAVAIRRLAHSLMPGPETAMTRRELRRRSGQPRNDVESVS